MIRIFPIVVIALVSLPSVRAFHVVGSPPIHDHAANICSPSVVVARMQTTERHGDGNDDSRDSDGDEKHNLSVVRRRTLGEKALVALKVAAAAFLLSPTNDKSNALQEEGERIEFRVERLDREESSGRFVIRTHPSWAPLEVQRFEELTKHSFWDEGRFFRVLPGFVAQFGIQRGNNDGMSWSSIVDDPVEVSNARGTVVFATSGPNTRTTQIFINTGTNNAFLDKLGFSPFGEVVEGMDVVDRLFSGYGEGAPAGKGPNQRLIKLKGKEYLEQEFPKLSYISKAIVLND